MTEKDTMPDEQTYRANALKMTRIRSVFAVSQKINVRANVVVYLLSIAGMYLWLTYTNAGIKIAHTLDKTVDVASMEFPFFAVTFLLTPVLLVLNILSDVYMVRKFNEVSRILYGLIVLFSVGDMILRYGPMSYVGIILLILYGVIGCVTENEVVKAFCELDKLASEEGFPYFNELVDSKNHSRFVKYREQWEKKKKRYDYYREKERPISIRDVNVTADENGFMDSVSVDADKQSDWFMKKAVVKSETSETDFLEIQTEDTDGIVVESDYEKEDIRRKPL